MMTARVFLPELMSHSLVRMSFTVVSSAQQAFEGTTHIFAPVSGTEA